MSLKRRRTSDFTKSPIFGQSPTVILFLHCEIDLRTHLIGHLRTVFSFHRPADKFPSFPGVLRGELGLPEACMEALGGGLGRAPGTPYAPGAMVAL